MFEAAQTSVVTVPFHGDKLEAVQNDGGIFVPLRRVCENLGLQAHIQAEKLKKKPWATTLLISVVDVSGKQREHFCIHLDSLPMWLATIEASRVKESVREKLALYQREVARVLADHFFGRKKVEEPNSMASVHKLLEDMRPILREEITMLVKDEIIPMVNARLTVKHPEPCYSLNDRLDALGWSNCNATCRRKVRELLLVKLRRSGYPMPDRDGHHPGSEWIFPAHQIAIVDEAIDQVWSNMTRHDDGPLFGRNDLRDN